MAKASIDDPTAAGAPSVGPDGLTRGKLLGHGAMMVFVLLISGSFSLGSMAAPFVSPTALMTARFILGAGLILGVAMAGGRLPQLVSGVRVAPWRYALLGGLFALYFILMFEALRIAPPAPLGAIFTLTPLMSAGFAWMLMRQPTPPAVLWPLLLGGAGAVWVVFRGDIDALLGMELGAGESLFLIGAVAHAAFTPLVRRLNRGESPLTSTAGTLIGAAILLALFGAPAVIATDWASLPPIVWITLIYLAIFTTAATSFLLQFAALRLPASKVMAYTYLTPSLIILLEGMIGHGWAPLRILPGVLASLAALWLLMREGS